MARVACGVERLAGAEYARLGRARIELVGARGAVVARQALARVCVDHVDAGGVVLARIDGRTVVHVRCTRRARVARSAQTNVLIGLWLFF